MATFDVDKFKDVREAYFEYKRSNPSYTAFVQSFVAGWDAAKKHSSLSQQIARLIRKIRKNE